MTLTRAVNQAITAILKPGMTRSRQDKKALKQLVCKASASDLVRARGLVSEAIDDYDPSPADRARLKGLRTTLTCAKGGRTRRMKRCGNLTRRR